MNHNAVGVALIALGLVAASGCATHSTPNTFNRSQVGAVQSVEQGTVHALRDVTIQTDSRGIATATGAVLGGIAGSTIGSGTRANTAGAVAGAAAGGALGNTMARGARPGVELTIELDNGRTIAVVQDGSSQDFRVGDRVRVTSDGTTTRVAR